ncbi:TAXI family TRAP transporter solute-binding subunit [Aminithiophilus ramosus]|uniref:TAXI family TRAP transporter solute-binding subunit n=1 Tax=Aminithiophilus ramosus TaxID=3029084 RepID=A0A9Q7A9V4_9BACT|nr:TAXI family TRAP transporter solute-binding subunit [Aminithiophilus ramosus]QTX31413.1 TAXI family TRAP transporter solute-binding subunit [Aminithiophilus ramosus]
MKKSLVVALIVAGLFAMAGSAFAVTFVTIGSGGVGGTYYPLGGAMAEVLSKADIGVKATSRSTSASRENCRLLAAGRAQIGMTMGSTLYQAYKGLDAFEQDGELPLRILMHMYPAPHHLVTTTKTGITSFEDIRGKKISLGAPGGGDQVLTQMILAAAGIDPDKDINKQQLTQPEGVMALKDGNVDAVFWNFATPGSAVLEVSAVRDVVLVPLPQDLVDKVTAAHPFLFAYRIPKETYPGQTEDVLTVADGNFLAVNADMDEKLGYDLVKTLIEHREEFVKVTQQAAHFVPEEASVGIIPFTAGAAKYFKEQGFEVETK